MAESLLRQRLAAILAADAAGYSRLMAADERATVSALDAARGVFRDHIEASQGRVIDMAGDSVLAVFETATGAVTAALAVQRSLGSVTRALPQERQMRFRIGINLGDVIVEGERLYGDGVNIAARLQTVAKAGGLCVSGVTYDQVRKILPLAVTALGAQPVKNIEEPIRAYEVKAQGVEASSALGVASALGDGKPPRSPTYLPSLSFRSRTCPVIPSRSMLRMG